MEETINLRFYSSFTFIINVIIAIYYDNYIYASLFGSLLGTSLIVHSYDNTYTNTIDKLIILFIIIYGGYTFYNKIIAIEHIYEYTVSFIIILTFFLTAYFYCYGYIYKTGCFCEDCDSAEIQHCIMHVIGSIGHNLIVLL